MVPTGCQVILLMDEAMTNSAHENRLHIAGWGASLALHLVAVGLAFTVAVQIKPELKQDPFRWEVSLVEMVQEERAVERAEPVATPAQTAVARATPARPVDPMPEMAMPRVAPQESVQMVHPVIEQVKPVEQKLEPLPEPKVEPEERKVEVVQQKVDPVEQKVETPQPKVEAMVNAEPLIAQNRPVTEAAPTETLETRPAHHESIIRETAVAASAEAPSTLAASAPAGADSPRTAEPTPASTAIAASPGPAVTDAPAQVTKATAPGLEAKVDHRWLAESLWRRVAELKRYPSSARLNGLEGKVVLKAVIRSDGHLAEVTVQKSSGHSVLDAAAIEAVRLACPLHMKHELGKPQIVVSLPIVYSLAN